MKTQEYILAQAFAGLRLHGTVRTVAGDFANTGTYTFWRGLHIVARLSYDFQQGTVSFTLRASGVDETRWTAFYAKDDLTGVVASMRETLEVVLAAGADSARGADGERMGFVISVVLQPHAFENEARSNILALVEAPKLGLKYEGGAASGYVYADGRQTTEADRRAVVDALGTVDVDTACIAQLSIGELITEREYLASIGESL